MTNPGAANGRHRLLVADDQAPVRDALRLLLKGEGYAVTLAASPAEAVASVQSANFALVLIDLNYTRDTTSGREGLDLLARLLVLEDPPPVVVMTAWATVDLAVEAMRRGARDFIQKPWENARVLATVRTQIELAGIRQLNARLTAENDFLRRDCDEAVGIPGAVGGEFVARSAAMRPVLNTIASVGPSDAPVLITGENGTGKGVAARALHAASARGGKPLVSVNMGGLSETIYESELFGHVKGAFTDAKTDRIGRFELADGGTLFLDEIANVPLPQQAKLLRLLETGEFERVGSSRTQHADVRLLSATNADLTAEVAAGRFRRDLLYRLNTVELHLPPLRDRAEDIPALAAHFLQKHLARYRRPIRGFDDTATAALLAHPWPGNVRELDHAIERAVLLAASDTIRAADLGLAAGARESAAAPALEEMSLEEVERFLIQKALARHGGKANAAAEALGLSRSAFYRRLQQYGW
jgi:DNA-binding NtrC family response regulator